MPAYNAAKLLPRSLPAALAAARGAPVVVVDPGSDDGTADVADAAGATVIRLGRRAGPAEARNEGVKTLDAQVALFVDADCVAHPDVVDRVREAFAGDPDLASITGSYDDAPPDRGFFSQYMNLRHHHTHQLARQDGASFWAGCGAVRVDLFRKCGGFDVERFPKPMIEDIELGLRIGEHGRTRLDPDLKVTHLKRWTLTGVVHTDLFCRAVPWSQLIVERGSMPNDLNLRTSQRVAAAFAPLALLSLALLPVALVFVPEWAAVSLVAPAVALVLNFDLFRFFAARNGIVFATGAWLFHQVHLFYSAVTFALVALHGTLTGKKGAKS